MRKNLLNFDKLVTISLFIFRTDFGELVSANQRQLPYSGTRLALIWLIFRQKLAVFSLKNQ